MATHLAPGLGTRNAIKLIKSSGDPERVFHASPKELRSWGLRQAVAESLRSGASFEDAA